MTMNGASALISTSVNGGETGQKVERTFNEMWNSVIASDPQTEDAVFVVGLAWVILAACGALFSLKKGWKKAGISLFFAVIPGLFLMFPQQTLLAFLGFLGFIWEFIGRFVEFVTNFNS
ncbi:hypothetical protein ACT3UA_11425 [Glutamicibacter sp. 363]|uniref:hypothetical protein n=1 Tax=unclassified Glutamicibacter TaxID=2627139 RepID=UPI00403441C8